MKINRTAYYYIFTFIPILTMGVFIFGLFLIHAQVSDFSEIEISRMRTEIGERIDGIIEHKKNTDEEIMNRIDLISEIEEQKLKGSL